MPKTCYRLRDNETGVSEVMGTLLILAITVVLFATIILWVANLPAPRATTKLDVDATYTPIYSNGIGANITIRHRGGEDLLAPDTAIFITIERNGIPSTSALKVKGTYTSGPLIGLSYGLVDGLDSTWNIGERWQWSDYSSLTTDRIFATVVDTARSTVLWSAQVLGAAATHPPIFLSVWADRDWTTPAVDTPETGTPFRIFARVADADNDILSVYAKLTIFYGTGVDCALPQRMYDDGTNGDAVANDGVFTLARACMVPTQSWDGSFVLLTATDLQAHATTTRMFLQVVRGLNPGNPFTGTWNATLGGIGQGDSGPFGDYGYNIYNATGFPTADNPSGTPTRVFRQGETVYVIARSTLIKNLENINSFVLRDMAGNKLSPPTREFDSRDPTKRNPAFVQTLTDPWYEYRYSFNTSTLVKNPYPLEFTLKDNAGNAPFFATDTIWITIDGTTPAYPRIVTYRDPNNDGVLSDLIPETKFKSIEKMYIRVFVKDKDSSVTYVNNNAGDVEIQDYFGSFPVKKRPGNTPVGFLSLYGYDLPGEASYAFSIDLLRRNQDGWVPGVNWYTLRIRVISDQGVPGTAESYQMLATRIIIDAPLSTIDIVSATEGGSAGKNRGVYWYKNAFYWQERAIEILPKDAKTPLALATGDLNGDTKVDVVIGLDSKEVTNIVAYYNLDYGTTWRRDFINQFQKKDNYRAESLAIGDLDGDGDGDLVAGVRDEADVGIGVIIFWNDGIWSTQVLRYSETGATPKMRSLAIGDINNDGRPDIVAGDSNGVVDYYRNNVRGSFLGGTAGIYPPGDPNSFDTGVKAGKGAGILYNSLRLGKMEGTSGDLDPLAPGADQTLDIVTSNDKDLIIYRTSVFNSVASFSKYDLKYTGDTIAAAIQSLAVGDMNSDKRVDIVVGIDPPARTSGVYRLRNMGMSGLANPPFNSWVSLRLPHTVINPKDGQIADLGKIKDLALGDTDGDGDLDIVFVADLEDATGQLNNLYHLENVGDDPATPYVETNVFTDGWFKRREKTFAVELDYIDL